VESGILQKCLSSPSYLSGPRHGDGEEEEQGANHNESVQTPSIQPEEERVSGVLFQVSFRSFMCGQNVSSVSIECCVLK